MTSATAERLGLHVINHEALVNPEVFRVPEPLTKLEVMSGVRKPVITLIDGEEFAAMMTQIYHGASRLMQQWGRFVHKEDTHSNYFTFTPWFNAHYSGVEGKPVVVDDRLRVVTPSTFAPNAVIHYERRIRDGFSPNPEDVGQVFKGFEVVLSASTQEASSTPLLIGGGRIDETDKQFWPTLSEVTTKAHKLFATI